MGCCGYVCVPVRMWVQLLLWVRAALRLKGSWLATTANGGRGNRRAGSDCVPVTSDLHLPTE